MLKLKKKTLIVGRSIGFFDGPTCTIVANANQVIVDNIKITSRSDLDSFAQVLSDAWKEHVNFAKNEENGKQSSLALAKEETPLN